MPESLSPYFLLKRYADHPSQPDHLTPLRPEASVSQPIISLYDKPSADLLADGSVSSHMRTRRTHYVSDIKEKHAAASRIVQQHAQPLT